MVKKPWVQYVSPKGEYTSARLHGVTSLKTAIFSHRRENFKSNIYFKHIFVANEVFKVLNLFLTMLNCVPYEASHIPASEPMI
jgi:hypothetical protein